MGEWWEPLATLWNRLWYKPVTTWENSISHTNWDMFQGGTGPTKFIPLHNWGGVVYSRGPCELTSTKYTIQEILVTSEFGWTPTHPAARGQLDEALQIVNGDPPPTLMTMPGLIWSARWNKSHFHKSPKRNPPPFNPTKLRKEGKLWVPELAWLRTSLSSLHPKYSFLVLHTLICEVLSLSLSIVGLSKSVENCSLEMGTNT